MSKSKNGLGDTPLKQNSDLQVNNVCTIFIKFVLLTYEFFRTYYRVYTISCMPIIDVDSLSGLPSILEFGFAREIVFATHRFDFMQVNFEVRLLSCLLINDESLLAF